MKWNAKIAITCVVVVCLSAVARVAFKTEGRATATYSQFIDQVRAGQVAGVVVRAGNSGASPATYRLKDGRTERTVLPANYKDAMAAMQDARVNVEIADSSSEWLPILMNSTPFLLLLGVWVFMMSRMKNGPGLGSLT